MNAKKIQLSNYRCFQSHAVELEPTSIVVGPNNAGKTTIAEASNSDPQDSQFGAMNPLGLRDNEYVFQDLLKVYQEAVMAGIKLFCITIDRPTPDVMGRMFGKALIYLPKISDLPRKLVEIFRKVS